MQSNWDFWDLYLFLSAHKLFRHETLFRMPLKGMFAPMLIFMDPSYAMVIAKAGAQLQDTLCQL